MPEATTVPDLLAHVDELERSGHLLDAIDLLTEANRADPDAALEVRLVEVRTAAFDQLDRSSAREQWPRQVADPFPDVQGVPPSIERQDLTPDIVAGAILHHGSLIVRHLVDAADVEELRRAITSAFDGRAARKAKTDDDQTARWFTPFEQGKRHGTAFGSERFVRIIDSPRTLFLLTEIYRRAGLVDVLAEHLGERPALSAHKCALRRLTAGPEETSTDFHQDGSFMGTGLRTVNVWLPLDACGGEAKTPGLDVVPRRVGHILETGVEGAFLDWTISESVVARAADGVSVVRPVFEPGDAMLFDELMVHRTGLDRGMTEERMAIESWFFAPSAYPDDHVPLVI